MDQNRFLIIGANGQLSKALQSAYPKAIVVGRDTFDITDWDIVSNYDWSKIDVILNPAAYTNVDGAETAEGRALAWKINATGPGYLSKIAATYNLTLVHISSETVFDGTKSPHDENEPFSPLGVYAQTKTAGDIAVSVAPKHYILRTSWLIGDGANFVRTMKSLAEKNISPKVVNDQTGRLTFTATLSKALHHLLENGAAYGTYNVSNDGDVTSWADIAKKVYELSGHSASEVTGIDTQSYFADKPAAAPRPLKGELSLEKIKAAGFSPSNWGDELNKYLSNENRSNE